MLQNTLYRNITCRQYYVLTDKKTHSLIAGQQTNNSFGILFSLWILVADSESRKSSQQKKKFWSRVVRSCNSWLSCSAAAASFCELASFAAAATLSVIRYSLAVASAMNGIAKLASLHAADP